MLKRIETIPIDPNFPKNHQFKDKYHFVWGPGRLAEAAENEDVKAAYAARDEELVPIGVRNTMVAVDWDCCIADDSCIKVCPIKVY